LHQSEIIVLTSSPQVSFLASSSVTLRPEWDLHTSSYQRKIVLYTLATLVASTIIILSFRNVEISKKFKWQKKLWRKNTESFKFYLFLNEIFKMNYLFIKDVSKLLWRYCGINFELQSVWEKKTDNKTFLQMQEQARTPTDIIKSKLVIEIRIGIWFASFFPFTFHHACLSIPPLPPPTSPLPPKAKKCTVRT